MPMEGQEQERTVRTRRATNPETHYLVDCVNDPQNPRHWVIEIVQASSNQTQRHGGQREKNLEHNIVTNLLFEKRNP